MMLVTTKFEIPHDLEPRTRALAKQVGLPLDIMCVMLLQDGYVTHLRQSIARAEADIQSWEEDAQ